MTRCDICDALAAQPPRPIQRKGWRLYPDYSIHNGRHAPITPQESRMLYVLAKAGDCVSAWTLGLRITRMNPDGDPANRAKTVASRIRRKLADPPFVNVRGFGYRWAA